jgi:hypothetical protein
MSRPTVERLDKGQLDLMWNFLMMGKQKANKPLLCELCDQLRQLMIQKTAGQRKDDHKEVVDFNDLPTVINAIVIETMALYLSGGLKDE